VENTEPAPPSPQDSGARRSSTPPSAGSGSASPPARDPAHELYRAAHRWHFAEQNCARAVDAWAAYLTAAPRGRFAPEARYNHALCLIRLGRYEQARSALAPFAHGHFGTYRQRDAQELLNALGRPD
jgi:TolA-binding protein